MPSLSIETVTLLARVAFLVGALTDGLAIFPMLSGRIGRALFGGESPRNDKGYRYAMGIGASLMAGWTLLLLWGAVRPIERRDLLLLTVCPVIIGIVASTTIAARCGVFKVSRIIPLLIHLGVISALYVMIYLLSIPFAS